MYKHSFKSYVKKSLYFIPVVALATAVILLRHRLSHVLIPVLLATLFSVLLSSPVNYLTYKRKFKRSFASFLALLLLIVIVLLILTGILFPLIVSIKDEGIGIAPEHHERLFERFYRVDKSRSQKVGGTGLGLSIVKHIAVLFGASLKVESEVGKGTTFFVTFYNSV